MLGERLSKLPPRSVEPLQRLPVEARHSRSRQRERMRMRCSRGHRLCLMGLEEAPSAEAVQGEDLARCQPPCTVTSFLSLLAWYRKVEHRWSECAGL